MESFLYPAAVMQSTLCQQILGILIYILLIWVLIFKLLFIQPVFLFSYVPNLVHKQVRVSALPVCASTWLAVFGTVARLNLAYKQIHT
jgi:hypothetical protein